MSTWRGSGGCGGAGNGVLKHSRYAHRPRVVEFSFLLKKCHRRLGCVAYPSRSPFTSKELNSFENLPPQGEAAQYTDPPPGPLRLRRSPFFKGINRSVFSCGISPRGWGVCQAGNQEPVCPALERDPAPCPGPRPWGTATGKWAMEGSNRHSAE